MTMLMTNDTCPRAYDETAVLDTRKLVDEAIAAAGMHSPLLLDVQRSAGVTLLLHGHTVLSPMTSCITCK